MGTPASNPQAAAQAQQPPQQQKFEQCGMDFFQLAARQFNIRYAGGVSFPRPVTIATAYSTWYQTVLQIGAHNQVALARLPNDPTKARPVIIRQVVDMSPGAKVSVNFPQPIVQKLNGRSLDEVMTESLYPEKEEDMPKASGPAQLTVYTNATDEATALIVNLCAALWDATTIKAVLQKFIFNLNVQLQLQEAAITNPQKPPISPYCKLAGWVKMLQDSITPEETARDPKYLPIQQEGVPVAKIADILPKADGEVVPTRDRRLSIELEGEVVQACRLMLQPKQATLNGLGSACFTRALTEAYFQLHPDESAVTIAQADQLDPRTFLGGDGKDNNSTHFIHAVGALSHGRTVQKSELSDLDAGAVVDWLVKEAVRWESHVKERLARGEGKTRTIEMVTNKVDRANFVQPAFEMVDHGLYETRFPATSTTTNDDWAIELGHRFDLCELMSVVVHVESASEKMKVELQMGKDQGLEATQLLFARCKELWRLVADSTA